MFLLLLLLPWLRRGGGNWELGIAYHLPISADIERRGGSRPYRDLARDGGPDRELPRWPADGRQDCLAAHGVVDVCRA